MNDTYIVKFLINEVKKQASDDCNQTLHQFISCKNNQGLTPLHYASYKGNLEILDLLLENGADINVVSENGQNLVHIAAQGDQPTSIVYLREKYNFNLENQDKKGSTPLHWSIFTGSAGAFKFLISYDLDFNKCDNEGMTPLHLAIESGKISCF